GNAGQAVGGVAEAAGGGLPTDALGGGLPTDALGGGLPTDSLTKGGLPLGG
ncbi:ATP-binding protein, partial [Streptomyces anulatus]|nr:ATP-binding protein [Streptomyces anulatus]